MSSSGDWPDVVSSNTAWRAREARIWSSSSRSCRITGRACHRSTTPTRSCCRGLPTCGGAPTRWFWNRRAPAPCSGYAIPRSRPPWLRCLRRNRSNSCAGRKILSGHELLGLLVDCQILFRIDAGNDGLRPDEGDDNLVLWDFHDLCSTRAAPRAGMPIRWAVLIPMRTRSLRCRPCARPGLERRSICAKSHPRPRKRCRQPQSFCANVIQHAILTTSGRLRSPSWRDFSTAPPASSRNSRRRSTKAVQRSGTHLHGAALSFGRRQLRARALPRRRHMRRAIARLLSLRCRRPRAGADRDPRQSARRAAQERRVRHGRDPRRRKS